MGRAGQLLSAWPFLRLSKLALQGLGVAKDIASYDFAPCEFKYGYTGIGNLVSGGGKTEQFSSMSSSVSEPSRNLFTFGDELFDVIVKIGKRSAYSIHILLEFCDTVHGGANRTAESDVRGNEFFKRM